MTKCAGDETDGSLCAKRPIWRFGQAIAYVIWEKSSVYYTYTVVQRQTPVELLRALAPDRCGLQSHSTLLGT